MKFITVEEHITSSDIIEKMKNSSFSENTMSGDTRKFYLEKALLNWTLNDVENFRIPYMDKVWIDIQIELNTVRQ